MGTLLGILLVGWPVIVCMVGLGLRASDVIPVGSLWSRFFLYSCLASLGLEFMVLLWGSSTPSEAIAFLFILIGANASVVWGLSFPYSNGASELSDDLHLGYAFLGLVGAYVIFFFVLVAVLGGGSP